MPSLPCHFGTTRPACPPARPNQECKRQQRYGSQSSLTIPLWTPGQGSSPTGQLGDLLFGPGGCLGDADGDGIINCKEPQVLKRFYDAFVE